MRKIVKMVICTILLFVLCLSLGGCGFRIKNPRRLFPLTEKEITKKVNEEFFDEEGNGIKWFWESMDGNYSLYDYGGEDITGFTLQFIKGLNGKEEWYLVEFEPTGHIIGCIYDTYRSRCFYPYSSPYKLLGLENRDKYIIDRDVAGRTNCGIEKDGYVISISSEANWRYVYATAPKPTEYRRVYNLSTQEWEENVYVGIFDEETKTWVKETQGEKK